MVVVAAVSSVVAVAATAAVAAVFVIVVVTLTGAVELITAASESQTRIAHTLTQTHTDTRMQFRSYLDFRGSGQGGVQESGNGSAGKF